IKRVLSGNGKKRPEIVTGNFGLHYEDIVQRNRYVAIALIGFVIVAVSAFIPVAVYRSLAAVEPSKTPETLSTDAKTQPVPATANINLTSNISKVVRN